MCFLIRKSFLTVFTALFMALLIPGAAGAQDKIPRAETQSGMNEAAGKDYAKADAEMTRAYKKLIAGLEVETQAKLRAAQRQWLKFRDAEAEFRSMKVRGGSIYPMVYARNLTALTQVRTKELTDAYKTFHTEGML